jgi:hypothetical protein
MSPASRFLKFLAVVLIIGFYLLAGSLLGFVAGSFLTPAGFTGDYSDGSTQQKIGAFLGFLLGVGGGILVSRRVVTQRFRFFRDRTSDFASKSDDIRER